MYCSQHSRAVNKEAPFETEEGITFDASRLQMLDPTQKSATLPDGKSTSYYEMYPLYNVGEHHPRLEPFHLQPCELTSYDGILEGTSGKKDDFSVCVKLYQDNPELKEFLETLKEVHHALAQIVFKNKGKVGLSTLKKDDPASTGFKFPVYFPMDKNTGEPLEGKPPSIYLKLLNRGTGLQAQKTVFMGVNGKEIDWKLLTGVRFKFIPLLRFEKVYIGGGRASLQIKVVSAIVTSMESKSAVGMQMNTLNRLKQNETLVKSLDEELEKQQARLGSNGGSSSSASAPVHEDHPDEEDKPGSPQMTSMSFSGIPDFANILGNAGKK